MPEALQAINGLAAYVRELSPDDPAALNIVADAVDTIHTESFPELDEAMGELTAGIDDYIRRCEEETTPITSAPTPAAMAGLVRRPIEIKPDAPIAPAETEELADCTELSGIITVEKARTILQDGPRMTQELIAALIAGTPLQPERSQRTPHFAAIKDILVSMVASGQLAISERNHPRWWGLVGQPKSYYELFEADGRHESTECREPAPTVAVDPEQALLQFIRETRGHAGRAKKRQRRPRR